MRLTESMMRKIIRQEATRILENDGSPFGVEMGSDRDDRGGYGDDDGGDIGDDDDEMHSGMTFVDERGTLVDGDEFIDLLKEQGFSLDQIEVVMRLMLYQAGEKDDHKIESYVSKMIDRAS